MTAGRAQRPVRAAAAVVRSLAERSVVRDFSVAVDTPARLELRFGWHGERPVRLVLEPQERRLTLEALLPEVPARGQMGRALRTFVAARSLPGVPAHRRLDPARLRASVVNHQRDASIVLRLVGGTAARDWEEACRRALKLANEIFFGFLSGPYEGYMAEHFGARRE